MQVAAHGFNRVKQCRHGLMVYNVHDVYVGRSFDLYGEYSEGETELFRQVIRPGAVALDIGANIGAYSLFFAQTVGPEGAVIAFEPQRIVYQTLCANMALNSVTNAYCYNLALGEVRGTISVPALNYHEDNNYGGISLGLDPNGDMVDVMPLDSMDLPRCDFMKIDVEGMELPVLRGAVNTLCRFQPLLYVENDRSENAHDLIRFLDSLGYCLYWHLPPLYNPDNYLENPDNVFGDIVSINMLCVHRNCRPDVNGLPPVQVPR